MARLAASLAGAALLVELAAGGRRGIVDRALYLATSPTAPVVPPALHAEVRDLRRSAVVALPTVALDGGDADELPHDRTSRYLADVLGLRGGSAVPVPPSVRDIHGGQAARVSHMPVAYDVRGGSLPRLGFRSVFRKSGGLWPLLRRADFPLRLGLMAWTVYDKMIRTVQLVVPKPFIHECEEFFQMVAGVELHAMEALHHMLEKSLEHHHDHPEAHRLHLEALRHIADEMKHGAQRSADFALSVSQKTFRKLKKVAKHEKEAVRHAVLRIADAIHRNNRTGEWEVQGESFDLSGKALLEAAEVDVTAEFVPAHVHARTRLKLLGLIASLGHDSVFRKVQLALMHSNDTQVAPLSIAEFHEKHRVNGAAELVKKLIHKYSTPASFLHGYLLLYTVSHLRNDPRYFQICWGLRLGALVAQDKFHDQPVVEKASHLGLHGFHAFEATHRGSQLVLFSKAAARGIRLRKWDKLQAANAFLTLVLFATGKTEHDELTMETIYDWLAERMLH